MKSRTKGQIAGQIFIYLMAAIVIGGIALIGYGAITKILSKSCDAEKASFRTDMAEFIEKYTSYGSVNKKTIKAPCEYDTVCFVDASDVSAKSKISQCANPIIRDSVNKGNMQNIFVIANSVTIPLGYSDLVTLEDTYRGQNCLCIKQSNKNFYITFKGLGSGTEISSER
jgi:hypothetical protein